MASEWTRMDGSVVLGLTSATKTCYAMSSRASSTVEEIYEATPTSLKWFQVYMYRRKEVTLNLIKRAERSGFKAVLLTVDSAVSQRRHGFKMPEHISKQSLILEVPNEEQGCPEMTWEHIKWLKDEISVPLVIKGVLTADDAALAAVAGVGGIVVSNHGGRQLDSVPATVRSYMFKVIDMLAEIVAAVAGRCEVYVDGGVRSGMDVVKALALGARAVFIGRPILWGLAYDGEKGVRSVLSILHEELKVTMALTGARTANAVVPSMIRHVSSFGKVAPKL